MPLSSYLHEATPEMERLNRLTGTSTPLSSYLHDKGPLSKVHHDKERLSGLAEDFHASVSLIPQHPSPLHVHLALLHLIPGPQHCL